MSHGIWIAASGAVSQTTALDSTANNLANANSPGYKAEFGVFREHLATAAQAGVQRPAMHYASVSEVSADHKAGTILHTGNKLDVAIRGDGYFAVSTADGERYTRAGNFQIDPKGYLTTADGAPVLDVDRKLIRVPANRMNLDGNISREGQLHILEDGRVMIEDNMLGRIKLVGFSDPKGLEKEGHTLFRTTQRSGPAKLDDSYLEVGAVEGANVSVVKGMTDIVTTSRVFEAMQKVIENFSEIDRRAANDIISRG